MDKAFRNSMFLVGMPLAICGISFALTGILTERTFAFIAPGLLIPGVVFMLIGWKQSRK